MQCPHGVIGKIVDFGYNDFALTGRTDICQSTEVTDVCKPNNVATLDELATFIGQESTVWSFNIDKFYINGQIPEGCSYPQEGQIAEGYIFASFECHHELADQHTRYNQVVMIGTIGILIAFMFMLWIRWSFQGAKIDLLEFDVATITAGDYTVEVKFAKEEYNDWYENVYRPTLMDSGISTALALKNQLRKEVQSIIKVHRAKQDKEWDDKVSVVSLKGLSEGDKKKALKKQKKKDKIAEMKKKKMADMEASQATREAHAEEHDDFNNIMVADITFAYRNQDLIELLQARGAALNALDFDKVAELEKEIDKRKNDPANFECWSQPEACFITFEADDAKETAEMASQWQDDNAGDKKYTLLGGNKVFKVSDICSEPTDIIW